MPCPEGASVPGEPDDGPAPSAPSEPPHSPAGRSRLNTCHEPPRPATPRSSITAAVVEDVRLGEEITEGTGGTRAPSSMNTCRVTAAAQRSHVPQQMSGPGHRPRETSARPARTAVQAQVHTFSTADRAVWPAGARGPGTEAAARKALKAVGDSVERTEPAGVNGQGSAPS